MPQIACNSLDSFDLTALETAHRIRRDKMLWLWVPLVLWLLLSVAWVAYSFHYFPIQRAERFEVLNRDRREWMGGPDQPDTGIPIHANQAYASAGLGVALIWLVVATVATVRSRLPGIKHNPGPVEESVRPDYGRAAVDVVNPKAIKMYFIRCRSCGKTLKQWECRG